MPPTSRSDTGRRHRAPGIPALLPSVVTRRGALGRGPGLAAQASPPPRKTKGSRGWGREKFSAGFLTDPAKPKRRVGSGRGAGFQERGHRTAARVGAHLAAPRDPCALPRPCLPHSRGPPPPGGCRPGLLLLVRDPQPPAPRPSRKVALLKPGAPQTKTCLWEENTRWRELSSGLEGQRVETDTPTAERALSAVDPGPRRAVDPARRSPRAAAEPRLTRVFPEQAPPPRPSVFLIRRRLGGAGSPWRAERALRERSLPGPSRRCAPPSPLKRARISRGLARKGAPNRRQGPRG